MTEDQLERKVERITDAHDRALMRGDITQEQYDALMRELAEWAEIETKKEPPIGRPSPGGS